MISIKIPLSSAVDFSQSAWQTRLRQLEALPATWKPLHTPVRVNRPGFAGGSNFQIGWSHDEQNDEQVFP